MRLERLAAVNFRNLEPFDLSVDSRFVVFHGQNAQGKTNALEALWLVSTLRGLRTRKHRDLVRWGCKEAAVVADIQHNGIVRPHKVELAQGQRRALLNGKATTDFADYFSDIRAIVFAPDDAAIVSGEPGRRRAWLDRAAFTKSPAHLDVVRTYKRTLSQKSALLKRPPVDNEVLDVLNHGVAVAGAQLAMRRAAILAELAPHVAALHQGIAGAGELVLRYRTTAAGESVQDRQDALANRLSEVRERELMRQTTLAGPQLDDLDIQLDGRSVRTYGSRGQIRSLVLALKLAELVAAKERDQTPMFLLDDLSSELDRSRTEHLVSVLVELGTQVFITCTAPEQIAGLPVDQTLMVSVESGELKA